MGFSLRSIAAALPWLAPPAVATMPQHLNVTALTHSANLSVLQCWSLSPPFQTTPSLAGAAIASLSAIAGNASLIVQPPHSIGAMRNARVAQWSLFVSGLGRIQILANDGSGLVNESSDEAWITGGKYGLIFADDVGTSNGHLTTFPSNDETVLLTFATAGGAVPEHDVLHEGPCGWEETVGT